MTTMLSVAGLGKTFTMYLRGGLSLPVLSDGRFAVKRGQCIVLGGQSGAGKSSILKMVWGNYAVTTGRIEVRHDGEMVDIAQADDRTIVEIRRRTVGYVSQFLRVVPRVGALDVVAEPLLAEGVTADAARGAAAVLLERLNVPRLLWSLPPATFSGGEQQRINIARGFITARPLLLLDEPTASLDAANRKIVIELVREKLEGGAAILGIFHDAEVREALADVTVDVSAFAPGLSAA